MLLQTNSYNVPKDKRAEHARLMRRFKKTLERLGCEHFEVYEQVGMNWNAAKANGRFVQIMRFRDQQQYQAVQAAERADPGAQELINAFCDLVDFQGQHDQGLFAIGFYNSALPNPRVAADGAADAAAADEVVTDPPAPTESADPSDDLDEGPMEASFGEPPPAKKTEDA